MQLEKISLPDTHAFSSFFLDYIQELKQLQPFYNRFPNPENFAAQITEKSAFPQSGRKVLVDTLHRQYLTLPTTDAVRNNIQSLTAPTTFTITTGHQLNIFTGPLYFIYKIVSVINTCKELKKKFPHHHFVPVYWMASEDHDFEEISYFHLYGKKYKWQTTQTGAVGRFNPKELASLLTEVPGDAKIFSDAYLGQTTLASAGRSYVNALFGDDGVVVIDADDRTLKTQLASVMEDDLFTHNIQHLVEEQTKALQSIGYHTQVNAREINFFYLDKNIRDRIEKTESGFKVLNQELRLTDIQLKDLIRKEPEKFSPNVILRPLYQEIILPNLAYIGGPSEVVYWLQLSKMFAHFKIPFPILMPRNFALVMDQQVVRKFQKTGLELKDFFESKNYLFNHWVLKNSHHNLSLNEFTDKVQQLFDDVRKQTDHVDVTLGALVASKGKQTLNNLEKIQAKLIRAEKRRQGEKLKQVEVVKDALFPDGNLQERTDNFLNFYQQHSSFITDLIASLDPFDYRMHVLQYGH